MLSGFNPYLHIYLWINKTEIVVEFLQYNELDSRLLHNDQLEPMERVLVLYIHL